MEPFEAYIDPQTQVKFIFAHSDEVFTTGVMIMPPNTALPKHNRPLAIENLTQVSGCCEMTIFDELDHEEQVRLEVGMILSMAKGKFHIHSNPYNEPSVTLFKAVGDITAIVEAVRNSFEHIDLIPVISSSIPD